MFEYSFDLNYLVKSKVISEHFPIHAREEQRKKVITSWAKYKYALVWGFITGNFAPSM